MYSNEENILVDFGGYNYLFDNDSLLIVWAQAQNSESATALLNMLNKVDTLQTYAISRGILDDSLATLNYSDSLNGCDGLDSTVLASKGAPVVSALYDLKNYGGASSWLAFISIRPTLGWFNGRTTSLQDWYLSPKLNMLASNTWWRGKKFFYWSWRFIPNLASYGYDNKAKSKL